MDITLGLTAEEQRLVLEAIVRHRRQGQQPPALTLVSEEPPAAAPRLAEALIAALEAIERETDPVVRNTGAMALIATLEAARVQTDQIRGLAVEQLARDQRIPIAQAARQIGISRAFVYKLKAAREGAEV